DVLPETDTLIEDVLPETDTLIEDVLPETDFEFYDKSPVDDDPARQIAETDQNQPFDDWQEEAAALAERQARYHIGSESDDLGFNTDDISTTPVEMHIGSQKRIDNYLALFELNRELNTIDDTEEFFDTTLYSVLGQLGAHNVIIFAEQSDQVLYPVAYTGVTPTDDWNLNSTGALYQALSKSDEIRYSGEFLKEGFGLTDLERTIFEQSKASLLLPLRDKKSLLGIIFIGPPLDRADYVIDDLEYLRLLSGNLVGPLQRIRSIAKHQSDTRLLNHQNMLYRSLAEMNSNVQTKKTIDEIYDVIIEYFKKELKVESLSLILLDPSEQVYKIFAGNQISPESLKRFQLPVAGSELIATISNLSGVFNLVDFKNHSEIISSYTGDDLSLMQFYQILPLINLNWLVGFITIHKSDKIWSEDEREIALIAANQLAPVLANCLIVNERETLFRDPFSPLEKRLGLEVKKALEFHSFLSIVDFKVKNVKKLLGANPMSVMTEFFQTVSRTATRSLHQTDYLSRMGPGRFVILLPGRNRKEAEIFVNRLQLELKQANLLRGSAMAPSYIADIINFPEDGDTLQKLIARLDQ
ncbi:MAG: diguanylate cyclase, partial [Leptonema sp. (in: Bacteria)]|nr:diguanylate cyclase [Leptonema sp. (in: bacteria)]